MVVLRDWLDLIILGHSSLSLEYQLKTLELLIIKNFKLEVII